MRLGGRLLVVGFMALMTSAHVGSPDAWFEGAAGPYTITVHIEAPPVIPGIAVVNVRTADSVERITAFVNTFDAEGGTPPPDELVPSADRPGWRSARLWVMNTGSNRVTVEVRGPLGAGMVVVPLAAVAQRRLAVNTTFIAVVFVGGAILMAGLLTLIGAAVREGVLEPGQVPDDSRHRRARRAMMRAAVFIALALAGMYSWWRAEDRAFRARLYHPLSVATRVDTSSGGATFVLAITDSSWLRRDDVALLRARGELPATGLIDDHGKLMHLFLVSDDGRSAMAHLHPLTRDSVTFTSTLPPLPAGTYRVFADIVQASGFTQTLTSQVVVPRLTNADAPLSDGDDSWAVAGETTPRVRLDDGTMLSWVRSTDTPLRANEEAGLRFLVEPPPGDSAVLEPYLGMQGHAAVVRDDGAVFIHLHPMGTISPAAQARLSPASMHVEPHAARNTSRTDTLHFPYAFPQPGHYSVWVQVKRKGRILTGSFRADVK